MLWLAVLVLSYAWGMNPGISEAKEDRVREGWRYSSAGKEGSFRKVGGKFWLETNLEGVEVEFEEKGRHAAYVELFDRGRMLWLRLHDD
ncbi:hypothetical protein [Singulisphaera sp. PoT]|uniref:hypothetical protein n=1 Tax=Singulisphaera sp. PoT TaxID=3411797 RepID=UPI003BF4D0CF